MGKSRAGASLAGAIAVLLTAGACGGATNISAFLRQLNNPTGTVTMPKLPGLPTMPTLPGLPGQPTPAPAANLKPNPVEVAAAKAALAKTVVVDRTRVAGYTRTQFGAAWTDNQDALDGHNGCGTRDDVLKRQLANVKMRSKCIVESGTLVSDPYTGKTINWTKTNATTVQVDHVVALSAAWDLGASKWDQAKRTRFANDVALNLLAVDGPTNMGKSDKTPGFWQPPTNKCFFAVKYMTATAAYGLMIDVADEKALQRMLSSC